MGRNDGPGQDAMRSAACSMLERVLRQAERDARPSRHAVLLPSGLRLEAALPETHALADGRVAMSMRIVAFHDELFPDGLPEWQHAIGTDAAHAAAEGLSAWAHRVLPVLEDAVRPGVRDCALLGVRFPARREAAPTLYQAILGPVVHEGDAEAAAEDEDPCPACMTTRIQDVLGDHVRVAGYTGLALFAGRGAAGQLVADCRVNGEPFPEGVERLRAYANAWPAGGYEFMHQYVIIRPAPAGGASSRQA